MICPKTMPTFWDHALSFAHNSFWTSVTDFGAMRAPKRNVPPRRAALFSFYCRTLRCQHAARQLNYTASADFKGKPVGS
jgi:hypothetical protein